MRTHPQNHAASSEAVNCTQSLRPTFLIFHSYYYGCQNTKLGLEHPKFFLPSISAVYQLLALSVWPGSKTISCFALKKWIT